ncbi:hypothetical protein AYI70_g10355 [Smittium culicis]|uniref:Uncharacterized protein n=1 Tax=Smittium culicis TaxID=133412 RepID=A0A1R1X6Y7_9FUNG|nr:hypothetical protein AYI70_g10355 [Smittium culicis]
MEQIAEIQAPASQDQVRVLTKLVQQLLRKNEKNQEPEDPYVNTRAPVTDLKAYPEFTEALPSIEEDFFRSSRTEEERKIAVYSCPRTTSTAIKKADTALYGIQVALAQAKRPIDYLVRRRIQDYPRLNTSEDPEVMFERTMRALLMEGLKLPGKPTQLVETDKKTTDGSRGAGLPHCQETSGEASTCSCLPQATAELEQQEFDQQKHCYGAEHQRCNYR